MAGSITLKYLHDREKNCFKYVDMEHSGFKKRPQIYHSAGEIKLYMWHSEKDQNARVQPIDFNVENLYTVDDEHFGSDVHELDGKPNAFEPEKRRFEADAGSKDRGTMRVFGPDDKKDFQIHPDLHCPHEPGDGDSHTMVHIEC